MKSILFEKVSKNHNPRVIFHGDYAVFDGKDYSCHCQHVCQPFEGIFCKVFGYIVEFLHFIDDDQKPFQGSGVEEC